MVAEGAFDRLIDFNVVLHQITNVMIRFDCVPDVLSILFAQSSHRYARWGLLT